MLLLLLRKGSYNDEFVIFKLSLPPYGAEKHIAAIEVNILFYIIFFIVYESAATSERLEVLYKLIKDYQKRSIAIKRRYCQLEAGYKVLKQKIGIIFLREEVMLGYCYKYIVQISFSTDKAADNSAEQPEQSY